MQLSHSFTVPASLEQTWETFMDLESVGGCFPGATVTQVTDAGFAGTVKVKLGPIALVYAGSGSFVERDDATHRAVIEAKGKDKRGNGTAGATVTIRLSDAGDGATRADVDTDLAVTGKPAQFGRGVLQDVSDKLLQQFVACVESSLAPPTPTQAPTSVPAPSPAVPAVPAVPPVPPELAPLDLGTAVLPALVRSYGPQIAAGLLVFLTLVAVTRRRRRSRR